MFHKKTIFSIPHPLSFPSPYLSLSMALSEYIQSTYRGIQMTTNLQIEKELEESVWILPAFLNLWMRLSLTAVCRLK